MAEHQLEAPLRAVRAGKLSFDRFAKLSQDYWHRLAVNIWRKWDKPSWVTDDDVEQELLLNAWLYIPRSKDLDKRNLPSLAQFVIWNSVNRTQKMLQTIRMGGKRPHRDKDINGQSLKSKYEIPFSAFIIEDEEDEIKPLRNYGQPADQAKVIERKQLMRNAALSASKFTDKLAFAALAQHDATVIDAAAVLYDNSSIRLLCRFDNEKDAVRMIISALERKVK